MFFFSILAPRYPAALGPGSGGRDCVYEIKFLFARAVLCRPAQVMLGRRGGSVPRLSVDLPAKSQLRWRAPLHFFTRRAPLHAHTKQKMAPPPHRPSSPMAILYRRPSFRRTFRRRKRAAAEMQQDPRNRPFRRTRSSLMAAARRFQGGARILRPYSVAQCRSTPLRRPPLCAPGAGTARKLRQPVWRLQQHRRRLYSLSAPLRCS